MPILFRYNITLRSCLKYSGIILLATLVVWYVHFQARNFIEGPQISLNETYSVVHHERTISIEGTTHNIVKLTLNGKEIYTNEEGDFKQSLVLENGYTIMTLYAEDRFGRKTSLTREYVHAPS